MTQFSDLKPDCRHFRSDRPCKPHKLRGRTCPECPEYDRVTHRVLLVKLAALGDVLRTTSLLPAIRARFPDAHLTWLTEERSVELLRDNPLVDEVWSAAQGVTAARLSTTEFDIVLCPDADLEAASFAGAARSGERYGFTVDSRGRVVALGSAAEHWFRMGVLDPLKRANEETYQTLVARALGLDPAEVREPMLEPTPQDRERAREICGGFGFDGVLIGLNTGSGGRWEFKQWTFENQRGFIRRAAAEGAGVVLLGGPQERELNRLLIEACDGLPVFDAGTDHGYGRFAALVENCAAVVTGDTFAMHVATARQVPTVVLFGPTSAAEIELYGRGTKILPEGLDCLGCYLPRCDVDPHCQARIGPDLVWDAVAAYVGG